MGQRSLTVTIRTLESDSDFNACISLQKEIWQFQDCDLVTARMMKSCVGRGGLALGAFDPNNQLEGFLFGFPVIAAGLELHHSHMLGAHPRSRDAGIGTRLKLAQRNQVLGRVPVITWTFDPLESRNAHLNFNKLGVIVRHYYQDLYGANPTSLLHSGIGTDRFLAEWWIDKDRNPQASEKSELKNNWGIEGSRIQERFRAPSKIRLDLESQTVLVEVPDNIQNLKRDFIEVAKQWRLETRRVLTHYLGIGYQVSGFQSIRDEYGCRISFYRLEK